MRRRLASVASLLVIWLVFCGGCTTAPRYTRQSRVKKSYSITKNKKKQTYKKNNGKHAIRGTGSYYGPRFHGKKTANGESFNMWAMTAAHKTLPFNTKVRVTNLENGKKVTVRINDRGPFKKGRIIDLSKGAAKKVGMLKSGTAKVMLEIISYD